MDDLNEIRIEIIFMLSYHLDYGLNGCQEIINALGDAIYVFLQWSGCESSAENTNLLCNSYYHYLIAFSHLNNFQTCSSLSTFTLLSSFDQTFQSPVLGPGDGIIFSFHVFLFFHYTRP